MNLGTTLQMQGPGSWSRRQCHRVAALSLISILLWVQVSWRRSGGRQSPCFARKHCFPTSRLDMLDHLKGEITEEERQATMHSLETAYEQDITKFGRRRQWEKAIALLDEMPAQTVDRNAMHYAVAIQAIAEKSPTRLWRRAFELLDELLESDLETVPEAYNWAIRAAQRARKWTPATALYKDMHERTVEPDDWTYRNILQVCKHAGLWEFALSIIDEMEEKEVGIYGEQWNAVMDACNKAHEYEMYDAVEDRAAAEGFEIQI
eukprot:TRINITY_DN31378_c0_g1_i1.p1 TRINITY_DN31378_c0_g1~~TRINITY_DN31378_c0_g1_i1.p1  ORF type:complete len:263 (-),score=52.83 TRINITY_DN31378_c0_g1_i1:87-875(-)